MIRVGVLSPVFCTGGVERWLITLAKTIGRGVSWSGMALQPGGPTDHDACEELTRYMPIYGTPQFSETGRDSAWFVDRKNTWDECLRKVCDCDILIVWGAVPVPTWYTGLVVAVAHGVVDWSKRQMEMYAGPRTRYVAVSREALKAVPMPHRLTAAVIPNGVELDRLQPRANRRELRLEYGLHDDEIAVAYIGRFSSEKEPTAAATAVHGLRKHGVRAKALYCGVGFDGGATERVVAELCGENAIWLKTHEVAETLEMADCVVCASPLEGFGLTRLEAMSRGVPLVCTNTGFIPEATEQFGQVATIIRHPINVNELMWAVTTAVDDTQTMANAAIAAYVGYRSRLMGAKWAAYFERLMNEERGAATVDDRPALSVRGTE